MNISNNFLKAIGIALLIAAVICTVSVSLLFTSDSYIIASLAKKSKYFFAIFCNNLFFIENIIEEIVPTGADGSK